MMDRTLQDEKKKVEAMLRSPDRDLSDNDLEYLAGLLERYPYFQPLMFLHAMKVYERTAGHKPRFLPRLAAYTGDRTLLYEAFEKRRPFQPAADEKPEEIQASPLDTAESRTESSKLNEEGKVNDSAVPETKEQNEEAEKAPYTKSFNVQNFKGDFYEWLEAIGKGNANEMNPSESSADSSGRSGETGSQHAEAKTINHLRADQNKDEKSLMNNFIKKQPKISRISREIFSAENMARKSVVENNELVSETLARINHKQGHYNKAIQIYEKLGLLYPDKMPYFAEKIEEVKQSKKAKN